MESTKRLLREAMTGLTGGHISNEYSSQIVLFSSIGAISFALITVGITLWTWHLFSMGDQVDYGSLWILLVVLSSFASLALGVTALVYSLRELRSANQEEDNKNGRRLRAIGLFIGGFSILITTCVLAMPFMSVS